jgi:gliding motility-associated-like protein
LKRKLLSYCLLAFTIIVTPVAFAQNEASKWCFGQYAGLDFMTNPPTAFSSSLNSVSGCSSIADGAGNLLFYTNGQTVWNQTHAVMANGTGLNGVPGICQSCIIVKQPGSNSLYHIFTTGSLNGLCYTTVDMSLSAGMGSVTVKNATLTGNTVYSRKVAAGRHCNGTDIWVITRNGYNSTNVNPMLTINFNVFLVTAGGVSVTPVVSPANNPWGNPVNTIAHDDGCMKVSPNGRKIGLATIPINLGALGNNYGFEVYDFNAQTGAVTNSIGLGPISNVVTPWSMTWGCEFSPDGTKFYGSSLYNSMNGIGGIFQWDLCAGAPGAIAASVYTVAFNPIGLGNTGYSSLQRAPNGKIYAVLWNQNALGVINTPNQAGVGCNFVAGGQPLGGVMAYRGLPNFVSNYIGGTQTLTPFTYTANLAPSCLTASFTAPVLPFVNCAAANYSVSGYQWLFGDPASGAANTSTLTAPTHNFSGPGTYMVKLAYNYSCGADTVQIPVTVNGPSLTINTASITCATLGSATVFTQGGTGPFSFTWMPTAQNSSVATGLNPGTYSITVTDNGTGCVFTTTSTFSSLVPLTGTVANSPSIACNGVGTGTASISLAGGSGSQYYAWNNGVSTQTTATAAGLGAGTHTVTVMDAVTSCSVIQFFVITQPPPFNLTISASAATVCAGSSISFTASNSGGTPGPGPGYTYTWTNGPASDTHTVSEAVAGNYVYTVSSSDGSNCLATQTVSVSFIMNPTVSVSHVSICPLQTGTLSASGATTYTWTNNGQTGSSYLDNPLTSTEYTVVGSAAGCSSTPVTASIVVMSVPLPTLTSNSPICNGQDLILNGAGGTSYAWTGPAGFSSALQNPTITLAAPVSSGVYNVTVTAANTCTAPASVTVVVNPTPTLSISGSTVCTGQTLSLSVSTNTANTQVWTGPLSFTSNLQSITLANSSLNQSGTYTVLVTSADGCINTATVIGSIVSPPSLTVSLSTNSLCAQAFNGSPNTITLTSSGANTYTLLTPNYIANSDPNGNPTQLSNIPPNNQSMATATLMGSNGVCSASISVAFVVVPNPTLGTISATPVICAGQSYTYTSSGANSYTWSAVTPGQTLYTTGSVAVANPSINSVFSVAGSSLGCSSAIQTSTLTVNPLPVLFVDHNPVRVCQGSSVQLSATGTGTSYSWDPSTWLNTASGSTVTASPLAQQSYQVISSLNSCTISAVVMVSVMPLPVAVISVADPSLCVNGTLAMSGGGGASYLWSGPEAFSAIGQDITLTAFSTAFSGLYTVTATGNNGCRSSATQSITVFDLPAGSFGNDIQGCAPFRADLTFYPSPSSAPISDLSWQVNGQSHSGNNFSYFVANPGTYSLLSTVKDIRNCSATFTVMLQGYPKPEADFYFSPEVPLEGLEPVEFINASGGAVKFNWHFIDNNGFRASTLNTSYLFEQAGTYPVSLVATNSFGCSDTVVKAVVVEPDFSIYVPNAFTPNDDGRNDVFFAKGRGIVGFHMGIFDRWGELIFETQDFFKAWDGTYRGQACKSDVYTWKISASDKYGKTKYVNGSVTLYR